MGMSASQARFLGLTARKDNVEYEGQQINQQRTVLGNQSANYYNNLLGMSVPVPPSVDNFTKTVYTFQDGSLSNSITSLTAKGSGNYSVSYLSQYQDDFSPVNYKTPLVTFLCSQSQGAPEGLYEQFLDASYSCYTSAMNYDSGCYLHVLAHLLYANGPGIHQTTTGQTINVTSGYISGSAINGSGKTPDMLEVSDVICNSGMKIYAAPDPDDNLTSSSSTNEKLLSNYYISTGGTKRLKTLEQKIIDLFYAVQNYSSLGIAYDPVLKNSMQSFQEDLEYALSNHYRIGASDLRPLGGIPDTKVQGGKITEYTGDDPYFSTLTLEQLNALVEEEKNYIAKLDEKYGESSWYVRYIENTSSGMKEPHFYRHEDLLRAIYNDTTGANQSHINAYKIGSSKVQQEIKNIDAKIEQDSSGRLINITLYPGTSNSVTYALTTNTITDQKAYDDAMNQYEFDKYQYDQSIQEINAKISITQTQDKNLELRLKQLDTEQDAISTEMDAVQKVIEKNVESTFKTFG